MVWTAWRGAKSTSVLSVRDPAGMLEDASKFSRIAQQRVHAEFVDIDHADGFGLRTRAIEVGVAQDHKFKALFTGPDELLRGQLPYDGGFPCPSTALATRWCIVVARSWTKSLTSS